MRWRVFWSPDAQVRLEQIIEGASDRARLELAAHLIDWYLARYPLDLGESRDDGVRIAYEYPLGIQYEVLQDVDTVIVYDIWSIDKKRKD